VEFSAVPLIPEAESYRVQKAIPGGTVRNWDSYGHKIGTITDEQRAWLCDPQTSGGLLVCVEPSGREEVRAVFKQHGLALEPFGVLRAHQPDEARIQVR
jgi:selenide,water dikinase